MIISIDCNCNSEHEFAADFSDFVLNYDFSHTHCPACNVMGQLSLNTSYSRFYISSPDQNYSILTIFVLKCEACGKYHSVLPFTLLPFCSYSYAFVLRTLSLFYFSSIKGNKSKVCSRMHISRCTLNNWLKCYSREQIFHEKIKALLIAIHEMKFSFYLFRVFLLTYCFNDTFAFLPIFIFSDHFSFGPSISNNLAN